MIYLNMNRISDVSTKLIKALADHKLKKPYKTYFFFIFTFLKEMVFYLINYNSLNATDLCTRGCIHSGSR